MRRKKQDYYYVKSQMLVLIMLIMSIAAIIIFGVSSRLLQNIKRSGEMKASQKGYETATGAIDYVDQQFMRWLDDPSSNSNDIGLNNTTQCKANSPITIYVGDISGIDSSTKGTVTINCLGYVRGEIIHKDEAFEVNVDSNAINGNSKINVSFVNNNGITTGLVLRTIAIDRSGKYFVAKEQYYGLNTNPIFTTSNDYVLCDSRDCGRSGAKPILVRGRFFMSRDGQIAYSFEGTDGTTLPTQRIKYDASIIIGGVNTIRTRVRNVVYPLPSIFDYVIFNGNGTIDSMPSN